MLLVSVESVRSSGADAVTKLLCCPELEVRGCIHPARCTDVLLHQRDGLCCSVAISQGCPQTDSLLLHPDPPTRHLPHLWTVELVPLLISPTNNNSTRRAFYQSSFAVFFVHCWHFRKMLKQFKKQKKNVSNVQIFAVTSCQSVFSQRSPRVFAKDVPNPPSLVFRCGFFLEPNSRSADSPLNRRAQFIPTLNSSRTRCVFRFHLPTNHSHTSPSDRAIHSAALLPRVHLGNKQTQALKEKEEGQRETDEDSYFPWNDRLFCQYQ